MTLLRTALIQQSNTADIDDNIKKLEDNIRKVANEGAELVVLQELHNTLYFCQTENPGLFDLAESIPGPSTKYFGQLAAELGLVIVTSLFERRASGIYHNTSVVLEKDGTIAGRYQKMHIPDDPGYYEKFYFTPGDHGFEPISTSVGKLGVLICWDQWFPEAARLMALRGAEILIYPTAIGYDDNDSKEEKERQKNAWIISQRGHAVANALPVISVNRTGVEADPEGRTKGARFWGNSFVAGPQGEILNIAGENEENLIVDIDLTRSENVRRIWPFFRDRRIDAYDNIIKRYID